MPEHDGEAAFDFEASEERLRQQRYKRGWWVLAGGAVLAAMFVMKLFASSKHHLVIDLRLGLAGALALIAGIVTLIVYRRRPLPRATLHKH